MKYIKKLGQQELGYRNGKHVTGGYFYISKAVSSFFPQLNKNTLNDSILIELDVSYRIDPIFLNLVYHNNKFNSPIGSRDEYRIYLNRCVAPDDFFFKPNDIVVFEKVSEKKYLLVKYCIGDEEYEKLNQIVTNSKIKGFHALIE